MNKIKKILFFSETLQQGMGGIASYAHDFADAYPNADILFVGGDFYEGNHLRAIHFDCDDFSLANAHRLIGLINSSDADLIINSGFALLSLVLPFIDDRFKVISISHFVDGKYSFYAWANAAYSDAIIALSKKNKESYGKDLAVKTSIVYNRLPAADIVNARSFPSDPIKIVFPGGSNRFKGADLVHKTLCCLLKSDLNFEFYWLGNTYLAGRRYVPGLIQDIKDALPADPRIKHVGIVDRDKAKSVIADSDIFFLPSRAEGFPITLSEALSHPCIPIVSDARHGSLDLIKDGYSGIVVPQNDVHGYVSAISDIIKNPEKYKSMAESANKSAQFLLGESAWRKRMDDILDAPPCHRRRIQFRQSQYLWMRTRLKAVVAFDKILRKYLLLKNFFSYPLKSCR